MDISETDIMEEFKSEIYNKLSEFEKSLELSHSSFSDLEREQPLNKSSLTATINNLENKISRTESELYSSQKSIINPSNTDIIIAQMNEKDKKLSELFNTQKKLQNEINLLRERSTMNYKETLGAYENPFTSQTFTW